MTEPERSAFNAGLEAAGELVMGTAAATRRDVKDKRAAEAVAGALDSVADGLAMLLRPEPDKTSPEARRRAFALVQA